MTEKCSKCGVSNEHIPLFRANPKGVPAEWHCKKCLDTLPDPEVTEIVDAITGGGEPTIIDKTGKPRSIKDLLEAKAALTEYLIKTPPQMFVPALMLHIPCVLEALSELIARRQTDKAVMDKLEGEFLNDTKTD